MASSTKFNIWIFIFVSSVGVHLASSQCPTGWLTVNTSSTPAQTCFKIYSTIVASFDNAAKFCQSEGGYLARDTSLIIHNALKPNVLQVLQSSVSYIWIGLTDNGTNAGWVWIGGSALGNFHNFYIERSGSSYYRDCVYVLSNNNDFKWYYTTACSNSYPFICQADINTPPVTTTTSIPLNCPYGWYIYAPQKTCIQLNSNPMNWPSARDQCKSFGGDLVRINTTDINNFIGAIISQNNGVYWIGLNDRGQENYFRWLDSYNKANFTNWNTNQPDNFQSNENCVTTDSYQHNKWNDLDCNNLNRFICQKSALPGPAVTVPTVGPTNKNCGPGWEDVSNADTCFSFNFDPLSWLDARTQCQSKGGDLASISSTTEQSYITGRVKMFSAYYYNYFWVGANDMNSEGGYQWTDGSPFSFINWDNKQPDNALNSDCVVLIATSGRWDDVQCASRNGYICKKRGKTTLPSLVTTTTAPAHLSANLMFGCQRGWDDYRGSCYKFVQLATPVDQKTARASCTSTDMGADLAAIIDKDENDFVSSMLHQRGYNDFAWIGLQDSADEGTFVWTDNTPVQFTNWSPNEPNNRNNEDCVELGAGDGRWNDMDCSVFLSMYICKKSKTVVPRAGSSEEQGCTNGSIGYGALCYSFVNQPKNFNDAQRDCRTRYQNLGNLATIDSGHLQAFLTAELVTAPGANYWLGLHQNNDVYAWNSGWSVSFTYWGQNHTGNERGTCVLMQHNGLWVNAQCNQANAYICESPRTGFTTPTTKSPATASLPCPSGWQAYSRLCYQAFSMNTTAQLAWGEARDYCGSLASGGSLVTISDNATQQFLYNKLVLAGNISSGHFWIGLNDRETESNYVWQDNGPFLYTNWAPSQPNDELNKQDCVEWILPDNNWNDDYCAVSKSWMCQVPRGSKISTTVAPTGIVSTLCPNSTWVMSTNNYCYFMSASEGGVSLASWFDARQVCNNLGADLASIAGDDENSFITSMISKSPVSTSFWIGLNDLDMETFGWTDQSPISYVNWGVNEPDDQNGGESCVEILTDGSWNDKHCQTNLGFVCKKLAGGSSVTPYVPVPATGGCPNGFVTLPQLTYCYYMGGTTNTTRKNFTDAITQCSNTQSTAKLASIHSDLEEKFLLVLLDGLVTPAWIGLNDRDTPKKFYWVDNLVVSYTNWGPQQPQTSQNYKTDCVDMEMNFFSSAGWATRSCSTPIAFVCEIKKSPNYPTAQPNSAGCPTGYQVFRHSCYKFFNDFYNWTTADNMCQTDHGHIATLNSGVEQAFVEILTGHSDDNFTFWLGPQYDMVSSSFKSPDGSPIWYTHWDRGEPKTQGGNTCVTNMVDGHWKVANCSSRNNFVCEINIGGTGSPSRPFMNFGMCPRNWNQFNGYCYSIQSATTKAWAGANAACKNIGGALASIHSDAESHYLTNMVGRFGKDVWIGLTNGQKSGFYWIDGTQMQYVYWAAGEPNNPDMNLHQDCVKMRTQDGAWADTDCTDQNAYLCKTAAVPFFTTPASNRSRSGRPTGHYTGSRPTGRPRTGPPPTGRYHNHTRPGQSAYGSSNSSLSGGAVAGIVVGILILVVIITIVVIFVLRLRGQGINPFKKTLLETPSGFDNATYSTKQGVNINVSDA